MVQEKTTVDVSEEFNSMCDPEFSGRKLLMSSINSLMKEEESRCHNKKHRFNCEPLFAKVSQGALHKYGDGARQGVESPQQAEKKQSFLSVFYHEVHQTNEQCQSYSAINSPDGTKSIGIV